ncbi:MAG: formylglycine-generating enzyme family protein, partial [Spirochaetes bacterium]|nr:formylglycine-generating enzyme family protein [Spirochaetota bacterium]
LLLLAAAAWLAVAAVGHAQTEPQAGQRATSQTGIATAWIPAGTFTMGSPANEIGRWNNEGQQRQVTISRGFWMGVYPVTQEEWKRVMGSNPSRFNANPAAGETQGRRPVEQVSWFDALVFANRLSIMEGLSPAYSIGGSTNPDDWGAVPETNFWYDAPDLEALAIWDAVEIVPNSTGWRLPTEAQWEYAARAGTTTAFSNGATDFQNQASVDGIGWFSFNSGSMTREVGLKNANPWGLHDIHGNVWELCWDRYGPYPNQAQTDPTGASSGSGRVNRGGSLAISARYARSANRGHIIDPSFRYYRVGFRLVRP